MGDELVKVMAFATQDFWTWFQVMLLGLVLTDAIKRVWLAIWRGIGGLLGKDPE